MVASWRGKHSFGMGMEYNRLNPRRFARISSVKRKLPLGVLRHTSSNNKSKEIFMSPAKSTAKTTTKKAKPKTAKSDTKSKGFSAEEKSAMRERAKELKAQARAEADGEAGEKDALAKIAEMKEPERSMAKRLHALIKESAPILGVKTWYGFPAYTKDGKIICFFQSASKFNTRYATLGFQDPAALDDGTFWPVAYALTGLTPAVEAKIAALVKKAVS
jgi:hypothetical protein